MNRISERIARLEAAAPARRQRPVRRHVLDCPLEERAGRVAAIEAAEPGAFHIIRVIVSPAETGSAR